MTPALLDVHFILLSEARANGFESSLAVWSLTEQQGMPLEKAVLRTSNGVQVSQTSRGDASLILFFLSTLLKSQEKNHAIGVVLE